MVIKIMKNIMNNYFEIYAYSNINSKDIKNV